MGIFVWNSTPSKIYVGDTEVNSVWVWDSKVRPTWPVWWWPLCFTAVGTTSFMLSSSWSPTAVNLEISNDGNTWRTYTIGNYISLNAWDKVYFRNTSETDTGFSKDSNNYYIFGVRMTASGQVMASWDITYLLNKNWTTTLSKYCFKSLFSNFDILTTCPELPATTLWDYCYYDMFHGCTGLTTLPKLPATNLPQGCYSRMFRYCSQLRLSNKQAWEYQTPYRIPTTWVWNGTNWWNTDMFCGIWAGPRTPTINTTYYYTSNTVI